MTRRLLLIGPRERVASRYPERLWCGDELLPVEPASPEALAGGDGVAAAVVDGDARAAALALEEGVPAFLGPHEVGSLHADRPDLLRGAAPWTCRLPTGLAPEVRAARDALDAGRIGRCRAGEIVTTVGLGPAGGATWEADAAWAVDAFEAVLTGLDLLRCLGLTVEATRLADADDAGGEDVLVHDLPDGGSVRQRIASADDYAVPGFLAELRGDEGRLLLRHEAAPGALLLWSRSRRAFTSPALPKPKANVQAPDTARGGAETARQLAAFVTGEGEALVANDTALDLVARATRVGGPQRHHQR